MKVFLLVASSLAVTPVQKVIQLLSDNIAKGKQEKHEEEVRFSAFATWCDDTSTGKQRSIEAGKRQIEQLTADIEKAKSDAKVLGEEIETLDGQINGWNSDKKAAQEQRATELKDFQAVMADYGESIDALGRAIGVLQARKADVKQDPALIQLASSAMVPSEAKAAINAFLQEPNEKFLNRSGPKANAYEFQSGGVVELLEGLLKKFVEEKRGIQKTEANAKYASQMMIQELTDQIDAATDESTSKQALRGKRNEKAAEATGDRSTTQDVLNEDTKYLHDLKMECRQKSFDYENRQTLRKEELEALSKAVEILSSGDVSGNADKHLPSLVATSFVQTSVDKEISPHEKTAKVIAFLNDRAVKNHSQILSLVASKVNDDPFAKVKKLISDMITRLMEEANAEATHKGFCDTELAANKQTRDQKTEEVEKLTAEAEQLRANIGQLSNQITELGEAIGDITKAILEATTQRGEEKEKNQETIADARAGQQAVARALQVLRDFYGKAADATSFAQGMIRGPADDAPATFDKPYKGQQASNTGVIGLIEVIESDFARLESETITAEDNAASSFKKFSEDSTEDKAVKEADREHKINERQRTESKLARTNKDLAGNQEELAAAMAYYDKLKPSCVNAGVSHEERVARREEEIESLKEALEILGGEDIA